MEQLDSGSAGAGAGAGAIPYPYLKKEEEGADAPGGYQFEGEVIRLTAEHFEDWRQNFSHLHDLAGLLTSRDAFLAGLAPEKRKNWFVSTAAWLSNKNEAAAGAKAKPSPRGGL